MHENLIDFSPRGAVEDRIWGHLLHDEQAGMMTVLEFLSILMDDRMKFPIGDGAERFTTENTRLGSYAVPRRNLLRCLVFNNPFINEDYAGHDDAWAEWCRRFNADGQNQRIITGFEGDGDAGSIPLPEEVLDGLRGMFGGDARGFRDFGRIISLLRASAVNLGSNKRWTSLFLFPWGRHCIFADISPKGEPDRLFFRRNGELLWLMLAHARDRARLEALIRGKILDPESRNPFDRFCRAVSELSRDTDITFPGKAALPLDEEHALDMVETARDRMDILCEDLIRIFELPIPTPDIVRHASRVISLNLLCYFIERSLEAIRQFREASERRRTGAGNVPEDIEEGEEAGEEKEAARAAEDRCILLCEMLQKDTSDVRRNSQACFRRNESLSLQAIECLYWARVRMPPRPDDDAAGDDEGRDSASRRFASIRDNHRSHWVRLHRAFAKDCGLASRLCTNKYRYVPSDDLLETLAAVLIPDRRMPLREFLSRAFERYGIAIGPDECGRIRSGDASGGIDHKELEDNRKRLERRLNALGLFDWLSDGCEFVRNPFRA